MTDYRAHALAVFRDTRNIDTRGIIAAILHLAESVNDRSEATADTAAPPAWQHAALTWFKDRAHTHQQPGTLTQWLNSYGFNVDVDTVTAHLWELTREGILEAGTNDYLTFMAR
ncbi:hypothetical protein [Streptomyces sp. NPDC059874]|uniref:hypothetical protein n=1 Tax=Streptomyces sp. NPDC059874 TaxID=3346983 RepID=UPI00365C343E